MREATREPSNQKKKKKKKRKRARCCFGIRYLTMGIKLMVTAKHLYVKSGNYRKGNDRLHSTTAFPPKMVDKNGKTTSLMIKIGIDTSERYSGGYSTIGTHALGMYLIEPSSYLAMIVVTSLQRLGMGPPMHFAAAAFPPPPSASVMFISFPVESVSQ